MERAPRCRLDEPAWLDCRRRERPATQNRPPLSAPRLRPGRVARNRRAVGSATSSPIRPLSPPLSWMPSNEPYIYAGRVTYQVQISRALNPFATEDSQYLVGVAPDQLTLAPDQLWFGVFLWAKNQTNTYVTTSDTFKIADSEGTIYHPDPDRHDGQPVGVDGTEARAPGDRARPRHNRLLWPHPGRLDPVQAQRRDLLQPAADAADLRPRPAPPVDRLARSLARPGRPTPKPVESPGRCVP